ncbi:MAG: M23 family metallopeptidase [Clostridia bacterium]|nr:M23 family metallopeptidase [Clostridia bacterium]
MIIPFRCDSVRVTSRYGTRVLNGKTEKHGGYDMVGIGSTDIVAAEGGTVEQSRIVTDKSNSTWQWGNYVCVKTDMGQYHYYCHMSSRAVEKGQRVNAGDKLGVMGNTGYSFGAHLHFEVRGRDGKTKISPETVLGITNQTGVYTKSSLDRDIDVLVKKGYVKSPLYWSQRAAQVQYLDDLIHRFAEAVK